MAADKPWHVDYFAAMRRAYAERHAEDHDLVPFAVLRVAIENRAPLPHWAALALLETGERLLQKPTRRGHNAVPYDRDVQRSVDDFRHAVVSKFRRTENLACDEAIERAAEYLNASIGDGVLPGRNGKTVRLAGKPSSIRDSYWRVEKQRTNGVFFPKLRESK
jgi:hypothetical protein